MNFCGFLKTNLEQRQFIKQTAEPPEKMQTPNFVEGFAKKQCITLRM